MEKADQAVKGQEIQLVGFELAGELYGVDINWVREILTPQRITRVPHVAPFVEGVINDRGRVVPVIDLRKRLKLPAGEISRSTRIAIVEVETVTVGMIVDSVSETFRLSTSQVEPASPVIVGVDADYLLGVARVDERLVILLDLARILAKGARIAV